MKILCWNVNCFIDNKNSDQIINTIILNNCDVLCLQECSDIFINKLSLHGYQLNCSTTSHCGKCCIFSRCKLLNSIEIKGIGVAINLKDITITTCHLKPHEYNHQQRECDVNKLVNLTNPTILCGDFNDNNLLIEKMQKVTNNNQPTWFQSFFDSESDKSDSFDHVYKQQTYNKDILIEYGKLGDLLLSDHNFLIITI